jgi:hypothetical protein
LDVEKVTIKTLEEKILKGSLSMVAPDAEIDGKGTIIISSEDPMDAAFAEKTLKDLGVADGSILSCDDFLQDYDVKVIVYHSTELKDGVEFELVGDLDKLNTVCYKPEEEENGHNNGKNGAEANGSGNGSAQNGEESAGDRKRKNEDEKDSVSKKAKLDEDDDGIVCLDDDIVEVEEDQSPAKKAKLAAATGGANVAKPVTKEDSELVCMDWSYLETQGAKRRVGPPRVRTTNTEPRT